MMIFSIKWNRRAIYTLQSIHCKLYTSIYTLQPIHCNIHTAIYTLQSTHWYINTAIYTLKSTHYNHHTEHKTPQNKIHTKRCTLQTRQWCILITAWTLHTAHYPLYSTAHCITLHTMHCNSTLLFDIGPGTMKSNLSLHYILHIKQCQLHTGHCTL